MNLKQLQYFRKLAQTEHMTRAAEELNITQPSLSHAMSELEKELGTFLFEKSGRNIRLTKYGSFFLDYVANALDELEKGERKLLELASPEFGTVDLAFIYTLGAYFAPHMVQAFKMQEAYHNIQFSFSQGNTRNILRDLKAEKFDLAFCSMIEENPEIHFTPIAEQEIVVIVHPEHPLAQYDEIDLGMLASEKLITFNQRSGLRPTIDAMLKKANIQPEIAFEVEEDHTMAGFVSIGYGVGILPRLLAFDAYQVKTIRIKSPEYHRYIYLASIKNRYLSPASRNFRDFAIEYGTRFFLHAEKYI